MVVSCSLLFDFDFFAESGGLGSMAIGGLSCSVGTCPPLFFRGDLGGLCVTVRNNYDGVRLVLCRGWALAVIVGIGRDVVIRIRVCGGPV